MSRPSRDQLTRTAWTSAGLELLAERGDLTAVAIEPLAKRLGATKGSFYWHFTDRAELLSAVLDRWREQHTEAVITTTSGESDPAQRLRRLFGEVMSYAVAEGPRVELALMAARDRTDVAAVLREVTERRIDYVAACYLELGHDPVRARQAAVLAYTAFAGLLHAQYATDDHLLDGLDPGDYLAFAERVLMSGADSRATARSRAARG